MIKRTTAAILSILLGGIGAGHFYTDQILRGILDILFCWTYIPSLIGLIEGLIWLTDSDKEFNNKFNKNNIKSAW